MLWASFDGALDSSVLIRTAVFDQDDDGWQVEARAGAGIVADSAPVEEARETEAQDRCDRRGADRRGEAMIPHDDRGLLLGDGLFETLAAEGGLLIWWRQPHRADDRRFATHWVCRRPIARSAWRNRRRWPAIAGRTERLAVRLTWTAGSGGRGMVRPDPMTPRLRPRDPMRRASACPIASPRRSSAGNVTP